MSEERSLISVGYSKGEMDFSVSGEVGDLTQEQMGELRKMTCVAIGIAEDMFRRGNVDTAATRLSKGE